MMDNRMRVRSAKIVRLMQYEGKKGGMRVMLQPRLRMKMNAQGMNGKSWWRMHNAAVAGAEYFGGVK
jgi:hypothetical protein